MNIDFLKNSNFSYSIDSRTIEKGQVFWAIKGPSFDGHDFLEPALDNGAIGLVIEQDKEYILDKISKEKLKNIFVILVKDSYQDLLNLAKEYRQKFKYPIIGITGSIGKTTTKELVAHILKNSGVNAYCSLKNLNSFIGLSLNILNLRDNYDVGIFEVGISESSEMAQKADILKPTMGLITNISYSHALGLGTLKNISFEKRELFKYFDINNLGIINGDQDLLAKVCYNHAVIKFGLKTKNNIQARKIKIKDSSIEFILKIYKEKRLVKLNTVHEGLIFNSLAAASICTLLNIDIEKIVLGLESYSGFENRFLRLNIKDSKNFFISDCYNANPNSMKAAIFAFDRIKNNGPKIAILGDMKELGIKEVFWHKRIGKILAKTTTLGSIILVGSLAKLIAKTAPGKLKIDFVSNWQQAQDKLFNILEQNKDNNIGVLLKASHSVGLENILKKFV